MQKLGRFFLIALFALAIVALVQPLAAQDNGVTDDEVNEIAQDIYCPVCENIPLDVCGTQACADWRELIRDKLADGESKQEIFEYFARQYGDGVLANPPRRGISLIILWVLPVVLILIGVLLFSRWMRSMRAEPVAPDLAGGAVVVQSEITDKDDYLTRVEEELGKK